MEKVNINTYNDGILYYGTIESTFNPSNRKKTGEDFTETGRLHFKILNSRMQDEEQANNFGYKIDLKVKVPCHKEVSSKYKVMIKDQLYDIKRNEINKKERYLYLEKVGV